MTEKLIRDHIPKIAAGHGRHLTVRTATAEELPALLRTKLTEETAEVIGADPGGLLDELADVTEVVHALGALYGHTVADIERARASKAAAHGRFECGLVMKLPAQ